MFKSEQTSFGVKSWRAEFWMELSELDIGLDCEIYVSVHSEPEPCSDTLNGLAKERFRGKIYCRSTLYLNND